MRPENMFYTDRDGWDWRFALDAFATPNEGNWLVMDCSDGRRLTFAEVVACHGFAGDAGERYLRAEWLTDEQMNADA